MRLIIILVIIGATCAVPRQSTRIVGGESTTIENYPFMASMLLDWFDEFVQNCGGSLITATSVLSSAHCYINDPPTRWRVRLGSTFASSGGNIHTLSRIILHDLYDPVWSTNDVAIMRLTNPAVFSNQIKIARIAGPRYILPDNTLVRVIGWGDLEFEGLPAEELHHVEVYTINQQICTERYAYLKTLPDMEHTADVTPEMMCVGILDVGGKDACTGDSGGPVIHGEDIVVGITSWSFECGHPRYPGVSARVSSYTDWIYTNSIN